MGAQLKKRVLSLSGTLSEHQAFLASTKPSFIKQKGLVQNLLNTPRPGQKLKALDIGFILFPAPTEISDVVGVSLLAFGSLLDRVHSSISLRDLVQEAHARGTGFEQTPNSPSLPV